MKESTRRQEKIKELLKRELISDQQKIVTLLKTEFGIETNQTVVSRDLHKLGVVKKPMKGVLAYEIPSIDIRAEILRLALIDIVHNESMIVIKTLPALADFVGDYLDNHVELDIAGCISGENTVFVAPKSVKDISSIYKNICQKLNFKPLKVSLK
jgi:transcriptional regulator of arginine metabolism